MIEKLQVVSIKLRWTKPFIAVLALASFGLFVACLFKVIDSADDKLLIPSLMSFLWSGLLFGLITWFPAVSPKADKAERVVVRIKVFFNRLCFFVLGIVFFVLSTTLLIISFRLIRVWLTEY
ncbi:hypothetical protein [Flavobacterium sp. W21_SRS_FM6]|uniref:hypothetical protein n=1 Tax=Flavobacterium sp. W21_SRS_FM6 TaxID=3240268 RepID=UPI003F91B780